MKKAVIFLAATTLLLGACGKEENKEVEKTEKNEVIKKEVLNNENEKNNEQLKIEEIEENEKENVQNHDHSDGGVHNGSHDHVESNELELMAEDIIVMYFNAISLKDVDTLKTINPDAIEENSQYEKLFQMSNISADVRGMQKISVNEKEAEYRVSVKFYTKESDDNFTDNISDYVLKIDLEKGTFKSKQVSNNEFVE